MKRDLDLIRNILLRAEEQLPSENDLISSNFSDICPDRIKLFYHVDLLLDNHFIVGPRPLYSDNHPDEFIITRLTSSGCDYLDAVRSPTIWSETKKKLSAFGGSFALDIVKSIATETIKSYLAH